MKTKSNSGEVQRFKAILPLPGSFQMQKEFRKKLKAFNPLALAHI